MCFNLSFPRLRILTFRSNCPCKRIKQKLIGLPLQSLLRSWILYVDGLNDIDILRHVDRFWMNISGLRMLVLCYE